MRAFALSDITSPVNQVTTIPFLLEGDAVEYYHSLTKVVQDEWFELMRVLGQRLDCISHEPVYLSRMLTLRESEFPRHADCVKEFRTCVIKSKVSSQGSETKPLDDPAHSHRSHCILPCARRLAYHTLALHMCTTASVHVQEGSAATLHLPPETNPTRLLRGEYSRGSDPNPATRRKALHQYARGRKPHATTLHAPPTPGYCLHGAITQRSRWHSFGPVSAQVHTDIKNVQSHLFTGREGAAVPAGGQGEKGGGGGGEPLCCRSTP